MKLTEGTGEGGDRKEQSTVTEIRKYKHFLRDYFVRQEPSGHRRLNVIMEGKSVQRSIPRAEGSVTART